MPNYYCYDLVIQLPFLCPVLPLAPGGAFPDVCVVEGEVPAHLPGKETEAYFWQASGSILLFRGGARSGRFLVQGGSEVVLQRNPNVDEDILAFHFLSSVMAAILRQRGDLVLHANSCVGRNGLALAVAGVSGAGKSTTLAALLAHGYRMLADDVTALRLNATGVLEVLPGIPQFHLTEDAAQKLGTNIQGLPQYRWRRMKAAVPAAEAMALQAAPLSMLFFLKNDPGQTITVRGVNGTAKFTAMQECLYGPVFPSEHPALFPILSAFMDQVKLIEVTRPEGKWTVDEVVEVIDTYV